MAEPKNKKSSLDLFKKLPQVIVFKNFRNAVNHVVACLEDQHAAVLRKEAAKKAK